VGFVQRCANVGKSIKGRQDDTGSFFLKREQSMSRSAGHVSMGRRPRTWRRWQKPWHGLSGQRVD